MNWVEILGVIATLFIIVSMSCKTLSRKSSIIMRVTNIIGSLLFVIYGILLPAISTAVLNIIVIVINVIHLVNLLRTKE